MTRSRYLVFAMLVALTAVAVVWAGGKKKKGGDPSFEIPWYTVDGGGGDAVSDSFAVSGTIGQHDAGTLFSQSALAGGPGGYVLLGGFWGGGAPLPCYGDTDNDGDVDVDDMGNVFINWDTAGPTGDVDYDGDVDVDDLGVIFINWGPC